jgi:hypothetical protein
LRIKQFPEIKLTTPYVEAVTFFNVGFSYALRQTNDDSYT